MTGIGQHRPQLLAGLDALGLALAPQAVDGLLRYIEELARWNRAYNLTAVREPGAMVSRHLLDSLALAPHLPGGRLIDVGSGAGLPGIPLAIARPQLRVALLDANGKKARFMRHALRTLKLTTASVLETRLEDYRPDQRYDAVTARAFAPLGRLADGVRHLLAPGGTLLAMRASGDGGGDGDREGDAAPEGYGPARDVALVVPGNPPRRLTILERT